MPTNGKTAPASCRNSSAERTGPPDRHPIATTAPVTPITTDALVIGAGPTGLFQVFQLGLLEIGCHVVDSLPAAGGQCSALYPDKPIYDIPGLPVCSGRELVDRLLLQIAPMRASFHFGQQVDELHPQADGRFEVVTAAGTRFLTRSVFIAGGVGSFQARRLKLPGLEHFSGRQVFHSGEPLPGATGQRVIVLGDDDAALACALDLADASDGGGRITLMHRRDAFRAEPALLDRLRIARASGRLAFVAGQVTGFEAEADGERLTQLTVEEADGGTRSLPVDLLLVQWGLSPKLGPIAGWGLPLERKQLVVDTERFETAVPRIYAVGDVNTYPGKKKLILCGFHEATLAAHAAAEALFPERSAPLQYTTTSPKLHRLLGVAPGP